MMAEKGFIEILNFMTTRVEVVVSIGDLVERLRFINHSTLHLVIEKTNSIIMIKILMTLLCNPGEGSAGGGNGKEASRDI